MDLFDLVAKLTLDSSEYEQGLDEAETNASGFGNKLGTAAKGAAAIGAAGATAVMAIGGAVAKGTGDVASFGDTVDKQSQKMGISAQAYQEWDQILQHNGASIGSLQRGMTTLAKAAEKNDDSFEKLGITQEELATMNREELFERTIAGLQEMEDGTERTVLAQKLLGGGAKELGPLLNMTAEETEAMRQKTHELGGVMSDEAVKAAAQYEDSLQDMGFAIDGVKRNVIGNFLPAMSGIFDGIAELFSGDSDKGIGMIKDGLDAFISKLTEMIPKLVETGTKIILALVKAITDNLPQIVKAGVEAIVSLAKGIGESLPELIPAVVDAILTIVETLIDNVDQIVDAGIELIIGLAEGLIEAIPKIIEKIPTIIQKLFDALVKAAPKIAEAGVKLLTSLVTNLPKIIQTIIAALPQIISSLVSGFIGAVSSIATAGVTLLTALVKDLPKIISSIVKKIPDVLSAIISAIGDGFEDMVQAGKDLLAGLGDGFINGVKAVIKKAKKVADEIVSAVKGFFGIASPSKVMFEVGEFLMEGMANGIEENQDKVEDAMEGLQSIVDSGMPEVEIPVYDGGFVDDVISNTQMLNMQDSDAMAGNPDMVRVINGMTINVYGSANQDVNSLADAIADRFQTLVDMRSAVWA